MVYPTTVVGSAKSLAGGGKIPRLGELVLVPLDDVAWLRCDSCDYRDDLVLPAYLDGEVLCRDCRSPFGALEFPEYYCDLGEVD